MLYLPSGKYLRVVSLGFPQVLADMIYIWSIQYYGNYEAEDRFKYLEHIYGGVISELEVPQPTAGMGGAAATESGRE